MSAVQNNLFLKAKQVILEREITCFSRQTSWLALGSHVHIVIREGTPPSPSMPFAYLKQQAELLK